MSRNGNGEDHELPDEDGFGPEDAPKHFTTEWSKLKGEPVLLLWLGCASDQIHRSLVDEIGQKLNELKGVDRLWLMLTSAGGEIDAAYHIARLLQRSAKHVVCVVPRWAKSAATLIAIGCHEIVMHPLAELGPLDAQVPVRRNHGVKYGSTLDGLKSVEYLRQYATETYLRLTDMARKKFAVDEPTAGLMAGHALSAMVQPIFAQIHPGEMGEHSRLLNLSMQYGARLMERSYAGMPDKVRELLLEELVTGYASHSFVIDFEEAKDLGLNVRLPDSPELAILDKCSGYFSSRDLHLGEAVELVTSPQIALPISSCDGLPTGTTIPVIKT